MMRTVSHNVAFLLFSVACYAQTTRVPKNLKQAVAFLNVDCPNSLKEKITHTADKDLTQFTYPWQGDYKTIFEWTKDDEGKSRLTKYLESKGVAVYQEQVILIAFKHFLLERRFDEAAIYKPFQANEKKWAAEDEVRFTTDSLRGVYIPKNLEECFQRIDAFWSDSTRKRVKSWTEEEFSGRVHLGFGMWMRNNWQLWGGSRLSRYFNDQGIYHPDDMSGIILTSYHRYLSKQAIDLPAQINHYQEYWEKSRKQDAEREQTEFAEYHVGDTLRYRYRMGYVTKAQEDKFDNDSCIAKGKVVEKNTEKRWLNVLLLESCDRRGIISYDNKNTRTFNSQTKKWEAPTQRIIKRMKPGQTRWFACDEWEPKD